MKVTVAKNSGFCKGVKYAVDTALSVQGDNVYVLGEIIHNPSVVKEISDRGIKVVESLDEIPGGATVIFRSHGVPESYYGICEQKNIKILDCTCGFVKRTQNIVKQQYALGRKIVIIGEKGHPEVEGLLGWCGGEALVLNDPQNVPYGLAGEEVSVVCQTTFSADKFEKIIKNIQKVCEKTVAVFKTICYTTIIRQNEVDELSKQCDAVLVIGGIKSSNTNKLYEIAARNCENVFRCESSSDVDYQKLLKFKSIGIVSGASTPDTQTREVLLKMEENTEGKATNTMEEVVAQMDSETKQPYKKGQIVVATISQATDEGLMVLLPGAKKEVALSKDEVDCEEYNAADYVGKIGDNIDLLVTELKPVLKLSQKAVRRLHEEEAMISDIASGKNFTVKCTGFNKGGLTASIGSYSVFVPAKEIRPRYVGNLEEFVGKTLELRSIEIREERGRKEIVASRRIVILEEREARDALRREKEDEFFKSISLGDVVEGKVDRVTDFGAFVSVKGFDCLAHISDLSWTTIDKVTDVLEIGKTYSFKILKIDEENRKVSIGYKQLQPQPWDSVEEKYKVGDVVHGKVTRLAPFGAFIEIEKGIDGLVHVSQIRYERIDTPASVLNVGDEVDAKITSLDVAARKMNLSIKELLPAPERKKPQKPRRERLTDEEKPARRPRTQRRNGDGEMRDWSDHGYVAISMADVLADARKNKE